MRFNTLVASAIAAGTSVTMAMPLSFSLPQLPNPLSPIPGYPLGIVGCLNDAQASFLVDTFSKGVLGNTNRQQATATANVLVAPNYSELSDSIATLEQAPLGVPSFTSRASFIQGFLASPPLTGFQTVKIVHDCTNLVWHWRLTGLGNNKFPVKGFNMFVVNPTTGVLQSNVLEFNSIAWGTDTGYTTKTPTGATIGG